LLKSGLIMDCCGRVMLRYMKKYVRAEYFRLVFCRVIINSISLHRAAFVSSAAGEAAEGAVDGEALHSTSCL
jgi:hypothetical protein